MAAVVEVLADRQQTEREEVAVAKAGVVAMVPSFAKSRSQALCPDQPSPLLSVLAELVELAEPAEREEQPAEATELLELLAEMVQMAAHHLLVVLSLVETLEVVDLPATSPTQELPETLDSLREPVELPQQEFPQSVELPIPLQVDLVLMGLQAFQEDFPFKVVQADQTAQTVATEETKTSGDILFLPPFQVLESVELEAPEQVPTVKAEAAAELLEAREPLEILPCLVKHPTTLQQTLAAVTAAMVELALKTAASDKQVLQEETEPMALSVVAAAVVVEAAVVVPDPPLLSVAADPEGSEETAAMALLESLLWGGTHETRSCGCRW